MCECPPPTVNKLATVETRYSENPKGPKLRNNEVLKILKCCTLIRKITVFIYFFRILTYLDTNEKLMSTNKFIYTKIKLN